MCACTALFMWDLQNVTVHSRNSHSAPSATRPETQDLRPKDGEANPGRSS